MLTTKIVKSMCENRVQLFCPIFYDIFKSLYTARKLNVHECLLKLVEFDLVDESGDVPVAGAVVVDS